MDAFSIISALLGSDPGRSGAKPKEDQFQQLMEMMQPAQAELQSPAANYMYPGFDPVSLQQQMQFLGGIPKNQSGSTNIQGDQSMSGLSGLLSFLGGSDNQNKSSKSKKDDAYRKYIYEQSNYYKENPNEYYAKYGGY